MSVPEGEGSGQNLSLFSSLRSFWSVLLAILCTRLDLATVELEEVGTHGVRVIVISLAALLSISMTVFFLLCFLLVLAGTHLLLVLGIVCCVCVLTSIGLVLAARHMIQNRPKFLAQTLAELRRDVEGLRRDVKTGEVPR